MTINNIAITPSELRARGYESVAVSILSAAKTGKWRDPSLSLRLSNTSEQGSDISAASLYQAWRDLGVSDTTAIRAVFVAQAESGLRGMSRNASSGASGLYQGLGHFSKFVKVSKRLADHLPMMREMIRLYSLDKREVSLWAFYAMHAQGRFATWSVDSLDNMRGFVNADRGTYDVGYGAQFSTTNGQSSCNDFGILVATALIRGLNASGLPDNTAVSITVPTDVRDFKVKDKYFDYIGPYAPYKKSKHIEPLSGAKMADVAAKAAAHAPVTTSPKRSLALSTNSATPSRSKPTAPTASASARIQSNRLLISTTD